MPEAFKTLLKSFRRFAPGALRDPFWEGQGITTPMPGLERERSYITLTDFSRDPSLGLNNSRFGHVDFLERNVVGTDSMKIKKTHSLPIRDECRRIGPPYFDRIITIEQPVYTLLDARLELRYRRESLPLGGQNRKSKSGEKRILETK